MSLDPVNSYDLDPHIAEVYDLSETYQGDVELIRRLVGEQSQWRILEPFCGTGRVLIPLALVGHLLAGMDQSKYMLERARRKISRLPAQVQNRIALMQVDVLTAAWPEESDLVILGGNCFYELALSKDQENCIRKAAASLKPAGFLYADNDHAERGLDTNWLPVGSVRESLSGDCEDGTRIESSLETTWVNIPKHLARFRRRVKVISPDGNVVEKEFLQQKHPVSAEEVRGWLEGAGFVIEQTFGDRQGSPYSDASPRAIFWARKG